jgi:Protein of unknown function (DUF3375)
MPKSAEAYLDDWAHDSMGWLRKFYPPGGDEAHFDLSPGAERAGGLGRATGCIAHQGDR